MPVLVANSFQCETCKRRYAWKAELAGKRLRCKCGEAIKVPVGTEIPSPLEAVAPAPVPQPPPPIMRQPAPTIADPSFTETESESTSDASSPPQRPRIFLALVVASVAVGAMSIWASWLSAAEWGKAFRGSAPGSSNPWYPGDPQLIQGLYLHALASIGLAVCLIGAGAILQFRPMMGIKLHLWYAVLKILFVLCEIVLCVFYFLSIANSGPLQIRYDISAGTTGLMKDVALQAIYPLAILVVMYTSQNIKVYVRSKRENRLAPSKVSGISSE